MKHAAMYGRHLYIALGKFMQLTMLAIQEDSDNQNKQDIVILGNSFFDVYNALIQQ